MAFPTHWNWLPPNIIDGETIIRGAHMRQAREAIDYLLNRAQDKNEPVTNALYATTAGYATSAGSAATADYAAHSGHAALADALVGGGVTGSCVTGLGSVHGDAGGNASFNLGITAKAVVLFGMSSYSVSPNNNVVGPTSYSYSYVLLVSVSGNVMIINPSFTGTPVRYAGWGNQYQPYQLNLANTDFINSHQHPTGIDSSNRIGATLSGTNLRLTGVGGPSMVWGVAIPSPTFSFTYIAWT